MEKWEKWKAKGGRWQVRMMGTNGELKDFDCPGAYLLHKKYARQLVKAGKRSGAVLVAEKMPKGH